MVQLSLIPFVSLFLLTFVLTVAVVDDDDDVMVETKKKESKTYLQDKNRNKKEPHTYTRQIQ
jgi:hypothetical protein